MEVQQVSEMNNIVSSIMNMKIKDTKLTSSSSSSKTKANKNDSKHHERSYAFIHITSTSANMYTHESNIQPVELTFAKLIPIARDNEQNISSNTSQSGNSNNSQTSASVESSKPTSNSSVSSVNQQSPSTNSSTTPPPTSVGSSSTTFTAISKSSIPLLLIQYKSLPNNLYMNNNLPLVGLPLMIVKPDNIESIYFENGVMRIVRVKSSLIDRTEIDLPLHQILKKYFFRRLKILITK